MQLPVGEEGIKGEDRSGGKTMVVRRSEGAGRNTKAFTSQEGEHSQTQKENGLPDSSLTTVELTELGSDSEKVE